MLIILISVSIYEIYRVITDILSNLPSKVKKLQAVEIFRYSVFCIDCYGSPFDKIYFI